MGEAAEDNVYMNAPSSDIQDPLQQVKKEFNDFSSKLEAAGVTVHRFPSPVDCADAVWPNNWFATLPDKEGQVSYSLYPLRSANRRLERNNPALLEFLNKRYEKGLSKDWSTDNEGDTPVLLEGTGSLVLDHPNRIAYVVISERTNRKLAEEWAEFYGYELVPFDASDNGKPVYHTNVVMAVGTTVVVVALDLMNEADQKRVREKLESSGKTVVPITREQVNQFCGNILELKTNKGDLILAMSTRAYNGFTDAQKSILLEHVKELVHSDISLLEDVGGGSCRCMLAQLF